MSDRTTYAWAAPYAGMDDDALKALGNAGLLRRARKDTVTEVSHDADGALLDVSGVAVRVDRRGPGAVTCDCPTAGVCQHVLTACLWAVGVAPAAAPGIGAAAVSASERPDVAAVAQSVPAQSVPTQTVPTQSAPAQQRPPSDAVRRRRREALAEVRDLVGRLTSGGLSHLGSDDAESLSALAGRVRLAGFDQVATEQVGTVRYDGLVRVAAGIVAGLAGRDDAVTESDLLDAFAEIWAMSEVLERAADQAPGTGTGTGTSTGKSPGPGADLVVDLDRWVPLGARWWTSQSGSRGLAYLGWEADGAAPGRVRQVVTGRPSGTDPRFQRSWTGQLLWDRSLSSLCEGPLALTGVRLTPEGALGAGGSPVVQRLGEDGFDLDELRAVAERTGAGVPPRDVVGFGRRPSHVRLVLVRDVGEVGIDEVRQEMTLAFVTSDGEPRLLRLPAAGEQAVETLLSVRSRLVAVTIERRAGRDEPVGLFVRDAGAIRLVSPTITPAWTIEGNYWDFWRRRIRRLRAKASATTVRQPATPPTPVRRVTLLLGDVLLATAATGRPMLTARQRSDVEQARALARDLGLVTLERTARDLLSDALTPGAVLRAAFVVGRARAVADVAA